MRITQGGQGGGTQVRRDPQQENPPGSYRGLGAGQGRKRGGGYIVTGHGNRRRHAVWGT